jgi:mono/diheme cytochrome c family protein
MRSFCTKVCFLASVLSACAYQQTKKAQSEGAITSISYAQVQEALFRPKCMECHGSSGGVDLSSYTAASANAQRALNAMNAGRMPPTGGASAYLRTLLRVWIEKGTPLESVSVDNVLPDEDIPPPPLSANFESIKTHIFAPKCISCHSPGGRAADLPLVTHENLLDPALGLLDLTDPAESLLLRALRSRSSPDPANDALPMPPTRSPIPALNAAEIAIIESWIQEGATN